MKKIKQLYGEIYREQKGVFALLMVLGILGVGVGLVMLANLRPSGSVVKILYSDLQGYQDGNWRDMIVFPVMAGIIGVLHNFLGVRIYEKRGKAFAKVFLIISLILLLVLILMFSRLAGER